MPSIPSAWSRKAVACKPYTAAAGAVAVVLIAVAGCTVPPPSPRPTGQPTTSTPATAASTASGTPNAVPTPGSTSPITASSIGEPLVVPGSDGMQHIEYDLLITNVFTAPVTLTAVDVRNQSGASLLNISGSALPPTVQGNFFQQPVTPAATVPVAGQVSVSIDVILPSGEQLPSGLDHVISWSVPADSPAIAVLGESSGRLTGFPLSVSSIQPMVIPSPLRGKGWMVLQGCCTPNGHRSLRYATGANTEIKAEMFALDWVQLQSNGNFFNGDGATNADFPYIGTDVLAVADGTVIHTRNGVPDEAPFQPAKNVTRPQDYVGNTVAIQIAPDRFAIYAHLEAGSIRVKPGDKVKPGDIVGQLGNSGNSTAAHLHFVITDGPDFITARSMPIVIDKWTLQGTGEIPAQAGPIKISGPSGPQTETLPLQHSVADFGN